MLNIELEYNNDAGTEYQLTKRETKVLELIIKGATDKQIAKRLIISIHTAKIHVRHILDKLNVETRVQAAVLAIAANIFQFLT